MDPIYNIDSFLDKFHNIDTFEKEIEYKFKYNYGEYCRSKHCRASYNLQQKIGDYFINEIRNNLDKFDNKPFETVFKIVHDKLIKSVKNGGAFVKRNGQGGKCGISQLGCYDISICIVRSIPNGKLPDKIYLIKDNTKGPWNYVNKVLQLVPNYINEPWTGTYKNIYSIDKSLIISKLPILNIKNCDEIETYLCKQWNIIKNN